MKFAVSMFVAMAVAMAMVACGGSDDGGIDPFLGNAATQEATATPETTATAAHTHTATIEPAEPTATPEPPTSVPPTEAPTREQSQQPRATPTPEAPDGPPDSGDWIDVDVSNYTVRLMNGTSAVQVIGPVAVGREVDTGVWESTRTGLFHVYSMDASLVYDAPYDTYISHWVGFDSGLANGFHSFLKDEEGNVVDDATGNVSNGCIRTGNPEAIYNFAEYGMPVWVHF